MKRLCDYLLISAIVLLGACSEVEPVKATNSEAYFPLQIGKYWIYQVNQTVYKEVEPKKVDVEFELKSEVVDAFQNLEGGLTFVIHNSKRNSPGEEWHYVETWSARSDEFKAVIVENDVPFIQLTYPLYKNRSWNGNDLNTSEADDYVVESVGRPYTTSNEEKFDDCVTVVEENYIDFTYQDDRLEIYARDLGLVYKRRIFLQYCLDDNCFGEQIIKSGEEWVQEIISYGQN